MIEFNSKLYEKVKASYASGNKKIAAMLLEKANKTITWQWNNRSAFHFGYYEKDPLIFGDLPQILMHFLIYNHSAKFYLDNSFILTVVHALFYYAKDDNGDPDMIFLDMIEMKKSHKKLIKRVFDGEQKLLQEMSNPD